jgi:hypothetical protein
MSLELNFYFKPCPFCNGKAMIHHGKELSNPIWIACLDCGSSTKKLLMMNGRPNDAQLFELRDLWNNRFSMP